MIRDLRALVFVFAIVVFYGKAHEVSLRGIDSNIHASVSRAIVAGERGLGIQLPIPALNEYSWGEPGMRRSAEMTKKLKQAATRTFEPPAIYNDHPVLVFLLNGWMMKLFGASFSSVRLVTALAGALSVLMVFELGLMLGSVGLGVISALVLALTREFVFSSAAVSLDPPLFAVIAVSFVLWVKGRWLWASVAAGIGFWVKTPVCLLVFPVMAFVELWETRSFRAWLRPAAGGGVALAVGALYWGLVTAWTGSLDLARDYWGGQFVGLMVGGGARFDLLRLPGHLARQYWPWLPFAVWGLWVGLRSGSRSARVSFVGLGVMTVVFSLMRTVLPHYFMPMYLFTALLVGGGLARFWDGAPVRGLRVLRGMVVVALIAAFLTPIPFAPERFPSHVAFAPIIQETGSCSDRIAWIHGGETEGNHHDAILWFNFVTARSVDVYHCAEFARSLSEGPRPRWVIASEENARSCPGLTQARVLWKHGTRVLLGLGDGWESFLGLERGFSEYRMRIEMRCEKGV